MATEIETSMEKDLINHLTMGDSQWTYAPELKTEEDLWQNFKSILEANNKDRLNGIPLTESEFQRVKNQVISNSFYDAGRKLVGENGVFHVKIQRNSKTISLEVFSRYQKAGGSSVYQVINQFRSFKDEEQQKGTSTNRRYDLSFLFNGLPLIHVELKNGRHASYMDAFRQIQKYINEGHFRGIFSLVQMFIVSNKVQTKYIAADKILNAEFLTSWVDENDPDTPVADLFDFADNVLHIPEAHEMITDYCQLDSEKERLMLLRPYQIQAIKAMRSAYLEKRNGYIWHATGSGKTLTSYKAARNLLFDIPNIDKTVFLIDRTDLDDKTCDDFESYAETDIIDVKGTDDTTALEKRLLEDKREMIITTVQKIQTLIRRKKGKEDESRTQKLRSKNIAFVVDECHRTVTRSTKVAITGFFHNTLWYGFTGTPIFQENQGSLDATTEYLYGKPLHCYTIKNALHDKAVLGFQVERMGAKNLEEDEFGNNINENLSVYDSEKHMLSVIDTIVNRSYEKFGLGNGRGRTYEAILTTGSIAKAQKYYELIQRVKRGETEIKIDPRITDIYPDFPKVAITYSLPEDKDGSEVNKEKMKKSLKDYGDMFGTGFEVFDIDAYNADLTKRFARKESQFLSRREQLDLIIVAERLLTGFDAPCLSTIFLDRQPMPAHKLIQAFSRTNRLYDKEKTTGYVVTFQSPGTFKNAIDSAVELFSQGGSGELIAPDFETVAKELKDAIKKLRWIAPTPAVCGTFGPDQKKKDEFCCAFQKYDYLLKRAQGYIEWNDPSFDKSFLIPDDELADYWGWYRNFMEERITDGGDGDGDGSSGPEPDDDYVLLTYGNENIDYMYIIRLIQEYANSGKTSKEDIDQLIQTLALDSPRLGKELSKLWLDVQTNPERFKGEDLMVVFENMKEAVITKALKDVCDRYFLDYDSVRYSANLYKGLEGEEIPNFTQIRKLSNAEKYSESIGHIVRPLDYIKMVRQELKKVFDEDVLPFRDEG